MGRRRGDVHDSGVEWVFSTVQVTAAALIIQFISTALPRQRLGLPPSSSTSCIVSSSSEPPQVDDHFNQTHIIGITTNPLLINAAFVFIIKASHTDDIQICRRPPLEITLNTGLFIATLAIRKYDNGHLNPPLVPQIDQKEKR